MAKSRHRIGRYAIPYPLPTWVGGRGVSPPKRFSLVFIHPLLKNYPTRHYWPFAFADRLAVYQYPIDNRNSIVHYGYQFAGTITGLHIVFHNPRNQRKLSDEVVVN